MKSTRVTWIAAAMLLLIAIGFVVTDHWARAVAALLAAGIPFLVRMSWPKKAAFACLAILLSIVATLAFVLCVDLYLHHRFAQSGGYNIWGYRGEAVDRKQPGEHRIVFLGGSVAFGYGVPTDETIPAHLERDLNQLVHVGAGPLRVINLGWNSEGAYSFRHTLQDYNYLHSDAAILYSGYNDLLENNTLVFRHKSAVFRLTGYLPILPII